jgi:hypothetical protein
MSVFNADLTMREPNAEEAREISLYPDVIQAQVARAHLVGNKIKERTRD